MFALFLITYCTLKLTDKSILINARGPARIAAATYCLSRREKNWNCHRHCEAIETIGTEIYDILQDISTGTFGFVTINHEKKLLTVAFRGTLTPQNIIQDALVFQKPIKGLLAINDTDDAAVHLGFLNSYLSIQKDFLRVMGEVLTIWPSYEVHFTGHSLGSIIAQIGALEASHVYNITEKISHYGFNSPRVGNLAYVKLLSFKIFRFTQGPDLISRLPYRFMDYRHPFAEEHWEMNNVYQTCTEYESDYCNNSIVVPYFDMLRVHLKFGDIYFGPWC